MNDAQAFSSFVLTMHIIWSICSMVMSIEAIITKKECRSEQLSIYIMCVNVGLGVMNILLTAGGFCYFIHYMAVDMMDQHMLLSRIRDHNIETFGDQRLRQRGGHHRPEALEPLPTPTPSPQILQPTPRPSCNQGGNPLRKKNRALPPVPPFEENGIQLNPLPYVNK